MNSTSLRLKLAPLLSTLGFLIVWQVASVAGFLPHTLVPSPLEVIQALIADAPLLALHAQATIIEALLGLGAGIVIGFLISVLMDRFSLAYAILNPCLVVLQTIPTVAIAPLLILWMGYDMLPKVILVTLTTFFPIAIALVDGFKSVSSQQIDLLRTMKATPAQIFRYVKVPSALVNFYSGLKISATYAIVAAVISEWLGGSYGLGVYMTRVRKSYAYDRMFAVIIVISLLSLILIKLVSLMRKKTLIWSIDEKEKTK